MAESRQANGSVQFGVFELDLKRHELRKHGIPIKLQPQPLQILQVLLERPGQVVTREELRSRLWPSGTFVEFDKGVYNAIKRLREKLDDDFERPRYIQTIPRQGYRFVAPFRAFPISDAVPVVAPHKRGFDQRSLLVVFAVCFGIAVLLFAILSPTKRHVSLSTPFRSTKPEIRSLAVLPMQSLSTDPGQEYFSQGMTDALITELARVGSLRVISRTSSMQYNQTKKSLPEIARELGVDGIIEGTVQHSGDRVRITAQLIYAPWDKQLWAHSYEGDVRDVFALQRDITSDIARQVEARLTTEDATRFGEPRLTPAALDAYLRGNSHMHRFSRGSGDEELKFASHYFRKAIDAEPDFAPAYVGISKARLATLASSTQDVESAKKLAERAIELDPKLSDGWTQLADIQCDFREWAAAEQDYFRALALNPNDADAHEHLGRLLEAFGRMEEGWKEAELAQQLDPNGEHIEVAFDHRHQYDQSIQHLTTMLRADPDNGVLHHKLYESYAGKGMHKEAIQELERTLVLFGLSDAAAKVSAAFAPSGYRGAMRKYAEELEHLYATKQVFLPMNVAIAYTAAGNTDRAFHWLQEGCKFRGRATAGYPMVLLNREPLLEPLHEDPRYPGLLHCMGLPQ